MRLYLHPHDRDGLPVEILLTDDEAEQWIARLQSAVRNVREGRGEQLTLFGEPARIVMTVQEGTNGAHSDSTARVYPEPAAPVPRLDLVFALGQAGFAIALAFAVIALFAMLTILKILP